jgi:hypothetical protein
MEKLHTYSEQLARVQKEICLHLTRITHLQELLRQEEEKLYACLHQEKILKMAL